MSHTTMLQEKDTLPLQTFGGNADAERIRTYLQRVCKGNVFFSSAPLVST